MIKKNQISFHILFSLIGFTAVIAQIVFIREFFIIFHGNEISFGIFLSHWLLWTACGSFIFGRWIKRFTEPLIIMPVLQILIAIFSPATIIIIRLSKAIFQSTPGEILGIFPLVIASFLTMSIFCFLCGGLFSTGSFLYAELKKQNFGSSSSLVYLYEAIGSGTGGLLVSLLLIPFFSSMQIALLISVSNALAASYLFIKIKRKLTGFISFIISVMLAGIIAHFDSASFKLLWSNFPILSSQNSIYGNLTILDINGSKTLYENGLVLFSFPDQEMNEEAVHYALLQHKNPEQVLLVGGGVSGAIGEIIKHRSVKRIDYVELDPTIFKLAREYFHQSWLEIMENPSVSYHHLDARLFLKQENRLFDVVIIHLPDPHTAQLNRFYTREFFQLVAKRLNDYGIISFQLTASENYISEGLANFLRCIHKTLLSVFRQVTFIPGNTIHFFAGNQPEPLKINADSLLAYLKYRHIKTQYIREYYIPFRLMPDRIEYVNSMIQPLKDTPTNKDFTPIAYYFDLVLWASQFSPANKKLFNFFTYFGFNKVLLAILVTISLLIVILFFVNKRAKIIQISSGLAIMFMGCSSISLQIILILAFQAIYGYVYYRLALLIAFFMMGMASASWMALRRINKRAIFFNSGSYVNKSSPMIMIRMLIIIHAIVAILAFMLLALFNMLANITDASIDSYLSSIIFPLLSFICGIIGGYHFPVVSVLYFSSDEPLSSGVELSAKNTGMIYSLDLIGSILGSFFCSILFIPLFGLWKTAILLVILNMLVIVCLTIAYYLRR